MVTRSVSEADSARRPSLTLRVITVRDQANKELTS